MSLTVKDLKNMLIGFKDDAIVTDCYNNDFIHISSTNEGDVIISNKKPIGICNRTGSVVFESELDEYSAYCPELDEDLFENEFTRD